MLQRSPVEKIYSRHGRPCWYHIADATAITVAQARKLANEVMYQVVQGKSDPVADRKAKRHAASFEELAMQYARRKTSHGKRLTSWIIQI